MKDVAYQQYGKFGLWNVPFIDGTLVGEYVQGGGFRKLDAGY